MKRKRLTNSQKKKLNSTTLFLRRWMQTKLQQGLRVGVYGAKDNATVVIQSFREWEKENE